MIVLSIVGGLVAVIILVSAIGAALPREHVVSRRATIPAPPAQVFAAITDYAGWSGWNPEICKVERQLDRNGHAVWLVHGSWGVMPLEVVESSPPKRHKVVIVDDGLPFGGTWSYALAQDAAVTCLTITEDGVVKSPIFRFLSRFVFGYTASIDGSLRALGRKFGAEVVPEDARGP
jgi:hypothetical protein